MEPVDEILELFNSRGHEAYFGENVSQLRHALQAAALAERAGSRSSLVVAALLHDVGHVVGQVMYGLPENIADEGIDAVHEQVGHAWLSRRFGPEITEPVRWHVAAKRYLCHREPGYVAQLSPSSVRSLELQGGPFTRAEAEEFEARAYFREAVAIRRWDDAAKVVGLEVPGLGHYRAMIAAHGLWKDLGISISEDIARSP